MPFSSYTFFIFILFAYSGFILFRNKKYEKIYLIFISFIFYAFSKFPSYLLILILFAFFNYYTGIKLSVLKQNKGKKVILLISIFLNLLNLIFYKYADFISAGSGLSINIIFDLALPLGISFYTLKNIAYNIDIYYERIEPQKKFSDYLLYISFFPTVSSGPIIKNQDFGKVISNTENNLMQFNRGLFWITLGLFFKIVLADNLSPYVSRVFDNSLPVTTLNAWTAAFAYSLQIYFDFNGYTYTAIGLGILFGYKVPVNFNKPYSAHSFTDFWKKWHITLSKWLRDYIFLKLSFSLFRRINIKHSKIKEFIIYGIAVIITFTICGIWHGAGWNFLLWGFFYGILLFIERIFGLEKKYNRNIFKKIIIFSVVTLLWVIFRADSGRAWQIFNYLFVFNNDNYDVYQIFPTIVIFGVLIFTLLIQHGYFDKFKNLFIQNNLFNKAAYIIFMAFMWLSILTLKGESDSFIYFKF